MSRRTIYRWIRSGELDRDLEEPPRYGPRPQKPRKLDPYHEYVRQRLEEFPDLTATRLFREIRASGYTGGYTQLKEYVRGIRPRPPETPVIRFETPPGKQAQVDFAHFRLPWGRRYALLVVLGYSRHLWFQFVPRQDLEMERKQLRPLAERPYRSLILEPSRSESAKAVPVPRVPVERRSLRPGGTGRSWRAGRPSGAPGPSTTARSA